MAKRDPGLLLPPLDPRPDKAPPLDLSSDRPVSRADPAASLALTAHFR